MVECFLSGKKARAPIVQGVTGPMGWYAGTTGISLAGYTGGFDMATDHGGYTGYVGYTGTAGYTGAGYTGVSGSTGIRGWRIDQGSSNFFNASWVSDPASPTAFLPSSFSVGGSASFIQVDVRGAGPEAFLAGTRARVGQPLLQRLTDFLRRNFPRAAGL